MPKGIYKHQPQQGFQKENKLGKKFQKNHNVPKKWRKIISKTNIGKHRSLKTEFKKGHSLGKRFLKGHIPWNKKRRIELNCIVCHKKYSVILSYSKRSKCCSRKCYKKHRMNFVGIKSAHWKGGISKYKKIVKCSWCNKKFKRITNHIKKINFCSSQCRIFYIYKNLMKRKDTSIELKMEKVLQKFRINYSKQVPIEKLAIVDFLLPNKIIIQCDGNYWHNLPKMKARDIKQDNILNSKGYKIYRFTETEINKSPIRCIRKVVRNETYSNLL